MVNNKSICIVYIENNFNKILSIMFILYNKYFGEEIIEYNFYNIVICG